MEAMSENKMNLWTLFFSNFKINDDVVLIDHYDKIICGKLVNVDTKGYTIKRWGETGSEYYFPFIQVRFMSHDGFPVKKLTGADGSYLIEKLDSVDPEEMLKEALSKEFCPNCQENLVHIELDGYVNQECWDCHKKENKIKIERQKEAGIVFGDPFMIEGVKAEVFNHGNREKFWHDSAFEEVLSLKAKDGACAELYDFNSIYYFDLR